MQQSPHNANYVAWSSKNITRNEYYKYINSIFLTPRTKAFIEECRLGKRELFPGFDKKFECSHKTNGLQYYRKMSTAEFNSFRAVSGRRESRGIPTGAVF
jgi:hypothetical protein